ncbi:MAG: hypothetical protein L6R40_008488 [Gallowayella cf. fulva]|nr:MAG: hypothetical protein L6R40_008488 [Xanthomendoza cf. fulva]
MELLPPPTNHTYVTLDELVDDVNDWAKKQGYAIRKQGTKKDPTGKRGIIKAFLVCSKWGITKRHQRFMGINNSQSRPFRPWTPTTLGPRYPSAEPYD